MAVEAQLQPADPPELLKGRKAWVQLNKLNTIVIPHDPEDDNAQGWACTQNWPAGVPVRAQRSGNEVVYFIDGKETLPQFQCEIEKTGEGDFIYLLGWFCDVDLAFPSGRTLREMLTEKAKAGVKIRMLLDGQFHEGNVPGDKAFANQKAIDFLDQLCKDRGQFEQSCSPKMIAAGVVDDHYAFKGCHHQKILVVKAGEQLTAFCGGVDINADRINKSNDGSAPIHDVHCRIRGPAARDLLRIFCDRWNDYMKWARGSYAETTIGSEVATPQPCGTFQVQVCRTFGHLSIAPYAFAPNGEQSIRKMIENAIQKAQRFIYFEDQYLLELDIAKLIAKQLPKLRHVTILIPPPHFNPWMKVERGEFLDALRSGGADKVHVYCPLYGIDGCGTYVHAKTWIFDDKFAVIGSANCNYRGFTHDSEASAGIYDASKDSALTYTFAHRLRIKLWAHHLGMDDKQGWAELADGVASVDAWRGASGLRNVRVTDFWTYPDRAERAEDYIRSFSDPKGDIEG